MNNEDFNWKGKEDRSLKSLNYLRRVLSVIVALFRGIVSCLPRI